MLIIAGHISVDPADVDQLMPAAIAMMEATRSENGCHEYVFSLDPTTPGRVMVYERWESQEALDAHFAAPHMAVFQQVLASITILARDILKYEIATVGPIR